LNGWTVFDEIAEYKRLKLIPSAEWRLTTANKEFKLCVTYPKVRKIT